MATYYYSIHAYRDGDDILGKNRDENGNHLLFSTLEKAREAMDEEIIRLWENEYDECIDWDQVGVEPGITEKDFGKFNYINYWEWEDTETLFVISRHRVVA